MVHDGTTTGNEAGTGYEARERMETAALDYLSRGLPITLCGGPGRNPKAPRGDGWQQNTWTADAMRREFRKAGALNVGLQMGARSGIIDIEADSPEQERAFADLFRGCEVPRTPTFNSMRGLHRLFAYDPRLSQTDKAVADYKGLGIRIGANDKGAQSLVPPSPNSDGTPREWIVSLDECDPGPLPDVVVERILAASTGSNGADTNGHAADPTRADDQQLVHRARKYINAIPNVATGERNQTAYRVAAVLVNDYALGDGDAAQLLAEWNAGNADPLADAELAEVLKSGGKYASKPHGCKATATYGVNVVYGVGAQKESDESDPWPDPLDGAAYHGVAGELVRMIEPHTEADPVGLLIQVLVAFGNVIGRTAHFRAEADRHYPNLFACIVGTTSKGRKGSSWGQSSLAFSAVDSEWQSNRVLGGLSSGEGLIWAVRDPIYKREPVREATKGKGKGKIIGYEQVEVDAGVTDKRLLVLESEFASVLKVIARERNTLSAIIRHAWDTGTLRTLTKNSPAQATGTHISIIGHITRNELKQQICETDLANGLANRFLWLCVRRSKCLPEGGEIHKVDFAPVVNQLCGAVAFAGEVGELSRDDDARAIWREVYPALSEGKLGLLGAATSRAEAQVMRLAMIYALLDQSPVVMAAHLLAGLAVWQYAEQSARYIFGSALGDPTADELLRLIRSHRNDGASRTDMRDHFGRNKSTDEIGRALQVLRDAGLAFSREVSTGGRPAERWFPC
ncbi:MAG: bifunctional DNA primase/polymerase [Pirellulales bacterium]